jgi:hypothetical protein
MNCLPYGWSFWTLSKDPLIKYSAIW